MTVLQQCALKSSNQCRAVEKCSLLYSCSQVGKAEFLGRATGKPHVHLEDGMEDYTPPHLEWFQVSQRRLGTCWHLNLQIYRGSEDSGELLAAFELFELGDSNRCGHTNIKPS